MSPSAHKFATHTLFVPTGKGGGVRARHASQLRSRHVLMALFFFLPNVTVTKLMHIHAEQTLRKVLISHEAVNYSAKHQQIRREMQPLS